MQHRWKYEKTVVLKAPIYSEYHNQRKREEHYKCVNCELIKVRNNLKSRTFYYRKEEVSIVAGKCLGKDKKC